MNKLPLDSELPLATRAYWHEGSHCIDWDVDPQRQLSIEILADGRVVWAIYLAGERLNGNSVDTLEFAAAIHRWSHPAPLNQALGTSPPTPAQDGRDAGAVGEVIAEMRAEAERHLVLVEDNPSMEMNHAISLTMRSKRLSKWADALATLTQPQPDMEALAESFHNGWKACEADAKRNAQPQSGEVVAWLTEDGRTVNAAQKAAMLRDGGACGSSMAPFTIPAYSRPHDSREAGDAEVLAFVQDVADHGLRADMNPTHDCSSVESRETFWHRYIRRVDEALRSRAKAAIAARGQGADQ